MCALECAFQGSLAGLLYFEGSCKGCYSEELDLTEAAD